MNEDTASIIKLIPFEVEVKSKEQVRDELVKALPHTVVEYPEEPNAGKHGIVVGIRRLPTYHSHLQIQGMNWACLIIFPGEMVAWVYLAYLKPLGIWAGEKGENPSA